MDYALVCDTVQESKRVRAIGSVVLGSLLLSLSSQIQIPLFFTPIPLVVQNSVAVMLGALLGAKKGSAAVLLFILYGWLGAPVFAGEGGLSVLLSPLSGGYLIGYVLAAFIVGTIYQWCPTRLLLAIIVGHGVVLLVGTSFLSFTMGYQQAWQCGLAPFIGFDMVKAIVVYKLIVHSCLWRP